MPNINAFLLIFSIFHSNIGNYTSNFVCEFEIPNLIVEWFRRDVFIRSVTNKMFAYDMSVSYLMCFLTMNRLSILKYLPFCTYGIEDNQKHQVLGDLRIYTKFLLFSVACRSVSGRLVSGEYSSWWPAVGAGADWPFSGADGVPMRRREVIFWKTMKLFQSFLLVYLTKFLAKKFFFNSVRNLVKILP